MKVKLHCFRTLARFALATSLVLLGGAWLCPAQLTISSFTVNTNGTRLVEFNSDVNSYFILYRGDTVTNIAFPVDARLGVAGTGQLNDAHQSAPSAFYRVRQVPIGQSLDLDGDGLTDFAELSNSRDPLTPQLVINEIDYDQVGTDTSEFVEIYNVSSNSVDLSSIALIFINGSDGQQLLRTNLLGVLPGGGYLVLASTNVTVAAGAQVIRFSGSQTDRIQNGAPDGVLLLDTSRNRVIDAMSYEGSIINAVITGVPGTFNLVEGTAFTTADSNTVNASLIRSPNGVDTNNAVNDWKLTKTLTPGTANVFTP